MYLLWGHFVFVQAFIKLESIESLTQEQKNAYEELALEIFTKYVAFKHFKARMGSCQYFGFTDGAARYIVINSFTVTTVLYGTQFTSNNKLVTIAKKSTRS